MKRFFLSAGIFPLLFALLAAGYPAHAKQEGKSNDHPAQVLISSTAQRILDTLEAEQDSIRGNRGRLQELTEEYLLPHIEFEAVSQLVLGKYWRRATAEQKERFVAEFSQFLVRFYTTSLAEYTKGNAIEKDVMKFLPMREGQREDRATVRAEVFQPGNTQPIPVDYKLLDRKGEWKIYDVAIDGISMVANYRSSFANRIRRSGMDGLLKNLAERNAELAKTE